MNEHYTVLAEGPFDNLNTSYSGKKWIPGEEIKEDMVQSLGDWLVVTRDRELPDYNGNKLRLESHEVEDGELFLELGSTDYHTHVASRELEELERSERPNTLAEAEIVETDDKYIVLGQKSNRNEIGEGGYTLPSGVIDDPSQKIIYREDLRNEHEEELNVQEERIKSSEAFYLIETLNHDHLVHRVETDLDFEEVAEQWHSSSNQEFSSLIGFTSTDVSSYPELEGTFIKASEREDRLSVGEEEEEISLRPLAHAVFDIL